MATTATTTTTTASTTINDDDDDGESDDEDDSNDYQVNDDDEDDDDDDDDAYDSARGDHSREGGCFFLFPRRQKWLHCVSTFLVTLVRNKTKIPKYGFNFCDHFRVQKKHNMRRPIFCDGALGFVLRLSRTLLCTARFADVESSTL